MVHLCSLCGLWVFPICELFITMVSPSMLGVALDCLASGQWLKVKTKSDVMFSSNRIVFDCHELYL